MHDLYQQIAALSPEQRTLFEQRLKQRGIRREPSTIPRRSASAEIPLSFAQQRLWFIQQLDPKNASYNVPSALRIRGDLQIRALQQTFDELVRRHEALRTRFMINADRQPVQVIAPPHSVNLPLVDLSRLPTPDSQIELLAVTAAEIPFDLSASLLRLALVKINSQHHILLIAVHHIISDRWSVGVFLRELSALYNAFVQSQPSPLPDLSIQAADWAIWQRQMLQGEKLKVQIAYWQQQLRDLSVLELPTDRPRPAVPSYQGAQYPIAFSSSLSNAVKSLAQKSGTTLFTLLLTSFQILLYRYTQQDDITVGTDIANRDRAETSGLIGLLVNTLVLRGNLAGNPSFRDLLAQTQQGVLEAMAYQDLPFEKLVEVLNPDRSLSQMMPLFQVKLDLQLAAVKPPELINLTIERLDCDLTTVKYELRLNLQDTEQGINGQIEYSTDLFDRPTIARLANHFQILLAGIIANPEQRLSQLPLLALDEQQQLITWNQTHCPYPNDCIHQLFEAQVERTPDSAALVWNDQHLTYQCLNARANQLAHYLQSLGVQPEAKVAVCLERSPDLVITLLAILKAGGAYVPLDLAYPQERHSFILDNSQAKILITRTELKDTVPISGLDLVLIDQIIPNFSSDDVTSNLTSQVLANNLAYVIYTSGSTGQPKGVAIEHRNTTALLHWATSTFPHHILASTLASTSICFDLSIFEIFAPLSCGGSLTLVDNALHLPHLRSAHHLTLLNTVPSAAQQLVQLNAIPPSIQTVTLAGEALSQSLVQQLYQQPQIQQVYNLYGPSEDTTYSTWSLVSPEQSHPPIGRPIANTQAYLLDRHLNAVPIGVVGELYLGGSGVARGYLNRPELTAERFVPCPAAVRNLEGYLYRTGDLGRYLPTGELEYLGRRDQQVKLRGFRIELGEIEAALNQHPDIAEMAVIFHEANNNQQIIAYVVLKTVLNTNTSIAALQAFLQTKLPAYMIPAAFIQLEALPRLPNGKLDRKLLPIPDQRSTANYIAPETELEQKIADLWQQELGVERVGRHDNFFELGGHSLLGMTIVARIREALQVDLPLRYLFQAPTVAGLAARVETSPSGSVSLPVLRLDPEQRHQPFPLTDIQQAYWIGRNEAFELGNVATHGYREIETVGLTISQVERALQQLVERHEMLRVIVQSDGQQRILAKVEPYQIQTLDLRGADSTSTAAQLLALRARLSHQVLSTDQYPLFDIQAALLDTQKIRFCISFDVLIGDAWSFQLLGQELAQLLNRPAAALSPLTLSFRDYVLAEQSWRDSATYQQAQRYWHQRLLDLPPAPELPVAQNPASITAPEFVRRSGELAPALWQQLQRQAAQINVTPSGILLAAFAEILAHWSRQPAFTLNLTLFNRLPLHPEVNQIVGDFTSSLLLGIDHRAACFAARTQQIQAQLWQDLEHRQVSGVEVLRELSRQQQRQSGALMPVVFTSILNHSFQRSSQDQTHQVVYSLSQTSQVYLDHQVAEVAGALLFNWDAIEDLFPVGLLDAMFAAYSDLLEQLAQQPGNWQDSAHLLPCELPQPTAISAPQTTLHALFFQSAARHPDQPAIITASRSFTYQELSDSVCQLATRLASQFTPIDSQPRLIAVVMEKGWEQVVAVLGILAAGAAYLPIDPELPHERRQMLLRPAQLILTQPHLSATLGWADCPPHLCIDSTIVSHPPVDLCTSPSSLAYVIYTSGSTGQPKGVMIDHQAAVNTILDINQRFHLNVNDRVFALSSLSFDLSVYDIFGTLTAGAAMVLPDADKANDPLHWKALLAEHQVTVWNSVPALMQLGLDALPASLRLVLLSGDWIPLSLPAQIRERSSVVEIIGLGGATEAAIWSIYHPIPAVAPDWKSIPYGRPLNNQQVYLLNSQLELCPTWVTGDLYIAGAGLAQGYWQDDAKTNASFIHHPQTGERLYKTGDLGRYLPDGVIEFLGREDFQVKVNGHRIELSEIESALQQHPLIQAAVVTVSGEAEGKQLAAYVVPSAANKLDLKLQQRSIRQLTSSDSIDLPNPSSSAPLLRRQTYRQFLAATLSLDQFGSWLSGLRQISVPDAPLPKYRYASAGSLYPVQTYLYAKPNRIAGLAGLYYYHPVQHQLILLNADVTIDAAIYGNNQSIFEHAAFSLFLVAELDAIAPVYGEQARDFCLLEAGYISQLLMETAPDSEIGLCPIGRMEFEPIQDYFQLSQNQALLHGFVGGQIDPAWTQQWIPSVSQPAQTLSIPDQLRQHLQQQLPAYMIPATYILLEALPLTANGKVDRRALPLPAQPSEQPFIAPQTETERQIAAIWQQTLKAELIGIHDNFFDLGGNSLSATQVLTQMRQIFQTELSIRQFFMTPTIAELSQKLSSELLNNSPSNPIETIPKLDRTTVSSGIDPGELDRLSEQEIDALLQQMLIGEVES